MGTARDSVDKGRVLELAIYVLLSAVAGVLAAIFPARRAARLNVLEALVTE